MARDEVPTSENLYSLWTDEDRSEKRGLRASIALAVVFHFVLLAVTFPAVYTEEIDRNEEKTKVFVVERVRFRKPPPPPTSPPEKPVTLIPIPDPDPQRPEPYVLDQPPVAELELDDEVALGFTLPEAPPEPEEKIYIAGGEVERPERLHYVEPRYTEIGRRARTQGPVILQATIDKQGDVVDIKVLKSLPMGLTEEAVTAVRQWRYKPSTVGGRPVNVLMTVTVYFKLQ